MRFIFENLHCNSFILKPLSYFLVARPASYKHANLIRYLKERNDKIYIYINEYGTSLTAGKIFTKSRIWKMAECLLTCKLNGIRLSQIQILTKEEIQKNDILLCYLYDFYGNDHGVGKLECFKMMDCNHFHGRLPCLQYIRRMDCLIGESNIFEHCTLLKGEAPYADYHGSFIVKPYYYQERFKRETPWEERKNKAVATGTWVELEGLRYARFKRVYHQNCLHPMRRYIYKHKEELSAYMDSYVTYYMEDAAAVQGAPQKGLGGWIKKRLADFSIRHARQAKYHSFDMPGLYNQYKMAVVPEELTGLPAIGSVEAMACGCALVGKVGHWYEDAGLRAGIHYIGYDGSVQDLKDKISFYQKHGDALKQIAQEGCRFVREHLNGDAVARRFYEEAARLCRTRGSGAGQKKEAGEAPRKKEVV